jgi:hypothetical protein
MSSISSVATGVDLFFKSARPTSSPLFQLSTYAQSDYLRDYGNINSSNNEPQQYINMSNIAFDGYTISDKSYNISLKFPPSVTIIIAIVAGLMSLITIIGNVFVITAFIIDKSLRSYSNYFILNLSIADLLIGLLIPPYAPFLLLNYQWKLGRAACTVWLVLDYVVGSASVLCIVVISLDRYLLVSRGLDYVSGQRVYKAIMIMLTVWLIAFLNYAPAIVFWEIIAGKSNNDDDESCKVAFHDNLVYLTATACVEFFAPLISICVLNLAVYLNIRKRSRGLIRTENPKFTLKASTSTGEACMSTKSTTFAGTSKATLTMTSVAGEIASKRSSKNKRVPPSPKKPLCPSTSSTYSSSSTDEAVAAMVSSNHAAAKTPNQLSNNRRFESNNAKKSAQAPTMAATEEIILLDECKKDGSNVRSIARVAKVRKLKAKGKLFSQTSLVELNNMSMKEIDTKNKVGTEKTSGVVRSHRKQIKKKNLTMSKKSNLLARGNNLSKDKKVARSLFILVFVFVFCWVIE